MEKTLSDKLEKFFSKYKILRYQKGSSIINAQDRPDGIYFVRSGFVKMGIIYEDGRELTLNIFKSGSYFPMLWAIGNILNRHYYQALKPTELHLAPKDDVLDLLNSNPKILMELTGRIILGLNGILTNMELILFGDAYHRVLAALYLCAKRFGEKKGDEFIVINPSFTHQDIASLSGLTRETVSVSMMKAEKEKIVSYHRGVLKFHNLSKIEKELSIYQSGLSSSSII